MDRRKRDQRASIPMHILALFELRGKPIVPGDRCSDCGCQLRSGNRRGVCEPCLNAETESAMEQFSEIELMTYTMPIGDLWSRYRPRWHQGQSLERIARTSKGLLALNRLANMAYRGAEYEPVKLVVEQFLDLPAIKPQLEAALVAERQRVADFAIRKNIRRKADRHFDAECRAHNIERGIA